MKRIALLVFLFGATCLSATTRSSNGGTGCFAWLRGVRCPRKTTKTPSPFTRVFNEFVRLEMANWHIPGMSIAIVDRQNVFSQGFGFSLLPRVPATPDTLYYVGATTMAQTAACLASLINSKARGPHGPISWQSKISSIIPDEFVMSYDWATEFVSLDDAVGHRTGLPRHHGSMQREAERALSTADHVRNMRYLHWQNEPRLRFIMSDYMYLALSRVIETVTGKSLERVMRQIIWDPLEMKSTYFGLRNARYGRTLSQQFSSGQLAEGYIWNQESFENKPVMLMPASDLSGAGAILSTVNDYAKWIKALIGETTLFNDLVREDIETGRTIYMPNHNGDFDVVLYTLGWYRRTYKGRVYFWHDGHMIGFQSLVFWFPKDKFGFVIFSNSNDCKQALFRIGWKIIADRFRIPEEDLRVGHSPPPGYETPREKLRKFISFRYPQDDGTPLDTPITTYEGTYVNDGYGTIKLVAQTRGLYQDTLLVERPEMTWHYALRLKHVAGRKWMACESYLDDEDNPFAFHPAQFFDADEQPARLVISWYDGHRLEDEVAFEKVPNRRPGGPSNSPPRSPPKSGSSYLYGLARGPGEESD